MEDGAGNICRHKNTVSLGLQLLYSFQGVVPRKKSASQTDLKLTQTRDQNKRGIERSIQMKSNQVYTYSFACLWMQLLVSAPWMDNYPCEAILTANL